MPIDWKAWLGVGNDTDLPPLKDPLPMPEVRPPAEEEDLRYQLARARHEVGVLHRRIQNLKDTWPALYQQFFTVEGEAALSGEATPVRTRRKK